VNTIKLCFCRLTEVHNPNNNSIGLAVSAQRTAESSYTLQALRVYPSTKRNRNWHIFKILFLFPVSFTIEWKVGIAKFYLYLRFGADLLKKIAESESAHL